MQHHHTRRAGRQSSPYPARGPLYHAREAFHDMMASLVQMSRHNYTGRRH